MRSYDRHYDCDCHGCNHCPCHPMSLAPEKCYAVLSNVPGAVTSTLTLDRLLADLPQNGPFKLKIMLNQITRNNTSALVFTDTSGAGPIPGMLHNGNALRNDSLYKYCCEYGDCHGIVILDAYRGSDAPTIGDHISIEDCGICASSFSAAEVAPPEVISTTAGSGSGLALSAK